MGARVKKYAHFIGIDVSAKELDWAISSGNVHLFHRKTDNVPEAIVQLITELKRLPKFKIAKAVFCMEHTGIYCNHVLSALKKHKAHIVVEAASHIQNSLGNVRGKTDKMDAIRIADYAYRNREHLRLWIPKRPVIQQLAQLNALRKRLQSIQHVLKIPLIQQKTFVKEGVTKQQTVLCSKTIVALEGDVSKVNEIIEKTIADDEHVAHVMKIITSVPCIGPVTALNIVLCTNEFKDFNSPKKFACYAGVAPFARESGQHKGKARVSPVANKYMKSLLHLCAVRAKINVPEIKEFYERKLNVEKKNKMSIMNAIRYKLLLRVFACVNQDRYYEKTYQRLH